MVAAAMPMAKAVQRSETCAALLQANVIRTRNAPATASPVWVSQYIQERISPPIGRRLASRIAGVEPFSSSACTTRSTVVSCRASARSESSASAMPPAKTSQSAVGSTNVRVAMMVQPARSALSALMPENAWFSRASATPVAANAKTAAPIATPNAIHTACSGANAKRSIARNPPVIATAKVLAQ
jgi:hypothetical protein